VFFLLCLLLPACGGRNNMLVPGENPDITAARLFEAGNNAMRSRNYVASVRFFNTLREEFPFSPYTVEAELSLADSYYLDQEWLLAIDAYKEFAAMYPRHGAMPYVLYQIGVSNLQTYNSVDRPPTRVAEALSYFIRLRDSYPDHEYAIKAEEQIRACRRILAEYEVYSGDFFFRTQNYHAAWRRYMIVVQNFSDMKDLYEYADRRRHMAYFRYMRTSNEETRRVRENTWHNRFNWL
jgi:outer membrane protein assembly factor BamD